MNFERRALWSVWLSLWLLVPAGVRAQHALMLPHAGDIALTGEREAAQDAVREALREEGFAVTDTATLAEPERGCKQVTCAPAILAASDATLAAAVAVWRARPQVQVHVTLVDATGHRYSGVAKVEAAQAGSGARAALVEARGLQLLGPGPWVRIDGTPAGAKVAIDGRYVGVLPYRAALSAGDHELEVRASGHAPERRELHVPLDPASTLHVELALQPRHEARSAASRTGVTGPAAASALPRDAEPREEASTWNFVLGGALIAGGVALATIEPLQAAARDGECADATCDRVYGFGTRSALQVGAGAAVAGAGIALLLWQPLRVEGYASSQGARVALKGQF